MDADLMCAAGHWLGLDHGVVTNCIQNTKTGFGIIAMPAAQVFVAASGDL